MDDDTRVRAWASALRRKNEKMSKGRITHACKHQDSSIEAEREHGSDMVTIKTNYGDLRLPADALANFSIELQQICKNKHSKLYVVNEPGARTEVFAEAVPGGGKVVIDSSVSLAVDYEHLRISLPVDDMAAFASELFWLCSEARRTEE